jgi:hypothetical protein
MNANKLTKKGRKKEMKISNNFIDADNVLLYILLERNIYFKRVVVNILNAPSFALVSQLNAIWSCHHGLWN